MTAQLTPMEELKNRAYKTARARFIAARRLEARQVSLVRFIITLTLIQIVISIPMLIGGSPYAELASVLSITFSFLVASVSNSEPVSKDVLHAHLLHKCGMELMSLYRKIHTSPDACNIDVYSKEYDDILLNCAINHDPVDFYIAECQADKDKKEIGLMLRGWYHVEAFFKTYGAVLFYALLVAVLYLITDFFCHPETTPGNGVTLQE